MTTRASESLDLFENAIDSLIHGLSHLAEYNKGLSLSDAKQAVMNLVNTIDLLVLEKLHQINKDAIYKNEEEDIFGIGYRATIHVNDAYRQIRKHLNRPIDDQEWDAYQILKILRNSANHYRFTFEEEREQNIIFLLHYIARFIEDDLSKKLNMIIPDEQYEYFIEIIEGTEYGDILHERKEAARQEFIRKKMYWLEYRSVQDGGGPVVAEWPCSECGQYGVALDAELELIGKCAFCGYDHDVKFCERCNYAFDLDSEGRNVAFDDYWCNGCWEYYLDRD
ncbi:MULTISPECIES: hypothetical protein [Brevibacillus]|uniref:hypothetical protein n=1 Tax=Brevibacillus TaxID=55080 RepID=UPI0036399D77